MNIYMIGIGGIGMSALAQLYKTRGHGVSGEDRSAGPTTELLAGKGIEVFIGEQDVPHGTELVVYSDAVPEGQRARAFAQSRGVKQVSYFQALGELSKNMRTIAVAGTHGKTTTTAMLAKILKDSGATPTVIVGSLVPEFGSNFVAGGEVFVVEACEYKDHLLKLSPEILVITNLEWDHTDWFKTFEAMQETFRRAIEAVPERGAIVTNPHNPRIAPLLVLAQATIVDYTQETVPELQLIGAFNRENAQAAKAAATWVTSDVTHVAADASLKNFQGTWRRFEKKGETARGALVYDDYAHHPTAVTSTLTAIKEMFPGKKIVVAFHPHLYSRTRDLLEDFGRAFGAADTVIIAPIYPAREEPIPGVTAEALAEKITMQGVSAVGLSSMDEVLEKLKSFDDKDTLLITMGAGDIYKVAEKLV